MRTVTVMEDSDIVVVRSSSDVLCGWMPSDDEWRVRICCRLLLSDDDGDGGDEVSIGVGSIEGGPVLVPKDFSPAPTR